MMHDARQQVGQPRVVTVALCASAKKHAQSFVALERCAAAHNARVRAGNAAHEAATSEGEAEVRLDGNVTFHFLHLLYDTEHACMTLVQPPDEGQKATVAGHDAHVVHDVSVVDIVLHKVATFGSATATAALQTWCARAQAARQAQHKPRLVLLDPLERIERLVSRRSLYTVLSQAASYTSNGDGDDDGGAASLALIPHTFVWRRGQTTVARIDDMPVTTSAATVNEAHEQESVVGGAQEVLPRTRCCGAAGARREGGWWWVAKPEEGTGPAYTHHLVLWRSEEEPVVLPPREVQDRMPPEASQFILQEFYLHALPVVVKVYCIADVLFIDVRGTGRLLHLLLANKSGAATEAVTSGTSSEYALSAQQSLSEASEAGAAMTRSICIDSQDSGLFSSMRSTSLALRGASAAYDAQDKAVAACWNAFFAAGTAAHACMTRLARRLSSEKNGLGLSLYGFDVLLVPRHLAHEEQRGACAGIGYSTDEDSTMERGVSKEEQSEGGMYCPEALFDVASQTPTRLLRGCVPIVVDVNYFPGYKGVETASAHMLKLLQRKVDAA